MNLFDRFVLTLYSLALVVISLFVMAMSLNLISYQWIVNGIEDVYSSTQTSLIYFVAAVIFLIISVKFLLTSLRGSGQRRDAASHTVRKPTELGDVRITLETLESLALHAARRVRGVRDLKVKIRPEESGTFVHVRTLVDGETPIPDLIAQVQQKIKEHVESIAGITITEVTVTVTDVASGAGGRVRRVE
ncbi:alkaline shock response membrane anchor protein AmaP [Aneurinibacillus terranovensis]|uniref:alkaline shock response membrane anchor protein AmaP n=1 Tax=Aneurinibacillus terranovensis TaxID=278991 RepID=UPI0004007321|nr:alkaline shock response membrane anchor protein AmaP [Aneurinibacillus terranovensis]